MLRDHELKHISAFFYAAAVSNVLDRLTFGKAKLAGPFLDGCNVKLPQFLTVILFFFYFNFLSTCPFCRFTSLGLQRASEIN